jgi:hypothetical protein
MTLIGGQDTGLGNVDTAGQAAGDGGGDIVEITSSDGSVSITNPDGPVVDLSVPALNPPASVVVGLTFPIIAGVPTLTAGNPVLFPGEVAAEGELFADDGLQVTGDALVTGNAQIDGTTDFLGAVHAHTGAPVEIDDALQSNTSTSLNGTTTITGTNNLNGTTTANGILDVEGLLTVDQQPVLAPVIAEWGATSAARRFWAASDPTGSDADVGFSDVSEAAAGLVAVKTLAHLSSLIAPIGNGKLLKLAIQARAANATYADRLTLLAEIAGYSNPQIFGTDTNATAGVTAFDGTLNELKYSGAKTATGMNAAGYNPLAGATTTALTCQLNGGGAPAFPAEPALPLGARVRFDVATTTVALRNAVAQINAVPGSTALQFAQPLPAAPVAADIFYIELPGTSLLSMSGLGGANAMSAGSNGVSAGLCLSGLEFSGSFRPIVGYSSWAFVHFLSTFIAQDSNLFLNTQAFDTALGGAVCGGVRADGVVTFGQCARVICDSMCAIGLLTIDGCNGHLEWTLGSVAAGGIVMTGSGTSPNNGGTNSAILGTPIGSSATACRVLSSSTDPNTGASGGLIAVGSRFNLSGIAFTGMGANPAVALVGVCDVVIDTPTGSTSNTDVGLDLTKATGCRIVINGAPTVTGTAGDVRLSDGTIISWATAKAGVIDASGNHLFAPGNAPDHPIAVASGAGVLAVTNAPAGATTYARYFKIPDGAGGFLTIGSLT